MTTESDLRNALGQRLEDLCTWLSGALEIFELRDAATVALAKDAFNQWLFGIWDYNAGDAIGALAHGLQIYVECCVEFSDGTLSLEQELALTASPPWEVPEFNLLVAYAFADWALSAFKKSTPKQLALAAILYADAIEARENWDKMRGPAGARNPNTKMGILHQKMRQLDAKIAVIEALPRLTRESRRENAKHAAMAKLANDPKQVAKAKVKLAWEAREQSTGARISDAAFARQMCEEYGLDDADNVARWFRKWKKTKTG